MQQRKTVVDEIQDILINQDTNLQQKKKALTQIVGDERYNQLKEEFKKYRAQGGKETMKISTKEGFGDFANYVIRNYNVQPIEMEPEPDIELFKGAEQFEGEEIEKLPIQVQNVIKEESKTIQQIGKSLKIEPQIIDQIDTSAKRNIIENVIKKDKPSSIIDESIAQYKESEQFKKMSSQLRQKTLVSQLKQFAKQFKEETELNAKIEAMREDPNMVSAILKIQQEFREQRQLRQLKEQGKKIQSRQRKDNIDQQYQSEQQEQLEKKLADRKAQLLKDILNRHNLPNPNLQLLIQPIKEQNQVLTKNAQRLRQINKENKQRVDNEQQLDKNKLPETIQSRVSKKTGLRITELCC